MGDRELMIASGLSDQQIIIGCAVIWLVGLIALVGLLMYISRHEDDDV